MNETNNINMFKIFILILISSAVARHHHIVGGKSQADPSD